MKKVVALLVVFVFVVGCTVAFAAETTSTSQTQKKSMVRTFFGDFKKLWTKDIPNTPNEKSQTHRIWEQTEGRGKTGAQN